MFRIFGILIVWLMLCFYLFSLAGCAKKTPVEETFAGVQDSIVQLKEDLPPECQTDAVLKKLEEIELKRQMAERVCQVKIKDAEAQYDRLWLGILLVVLVFVAKIFIKK